MSSPTEEHHPGAEIARRFPEDRLLRKNGYRILSRPARGEATWIHVSGVVRKHSEAIARVRNRNKQVEEGELIVLPEDDN